MGLRADSSHGARAWPADRHATGSHANQEMTLSFIPKMIGMGAALLLAGPWMLAMLVEFTGGLMNAFFLLG